MIKLQLINWYNIRYRFCDGRALIAGIIREWIMPFVSSHWSVPKNGGPPLSGATCNFNDQVLHYGILFLTFINTNVFYLLSFKFSRYYLLRPWCFPWRSNLFKISDYAKQKYMCLRSSDWPYFSAADPNLFSRQFDPNCY